MPSTAGSSPQNPLAQTTRFGYDEHRNRVTLVAPGREVTYYGYGALDRLALVRADALCLDAATYCVYDPAGSRTCLIHPASHPTHLSHGPLGRLGSERQDRNGGGRRECRAGSHIRLFKLPGTLVLWCPRKYSV
jgi:YD repeat-containing protein